MHCTYCGMPKGTCRVEATLNSEKIKPVALAVIELRLSEGISQSVTQSVSYSVSQLLSQSAENSIKYFFFKFCSNLLKMFGVDLKTLVWAYFYLTTTASSLSGKIEAAVWVMLSCGPRLLLCGPYYTVLSYCMIKYIKILSFIVKLHCTAS